MNGMLKLYKVKIKVKSYVDLRSVKCLTEPIGSHTAVTFYKEKRTFKVGHCVFVKDFLNFRRRGRFYMRNKVAYIEQDLPVYYE
jgi:hypothetical protein